MSKISQPRLPGPSQSRLRPPSTINTPKSGPDVSKEAGKTQKDAKKTGNKGPEFQLPPLSIVGKKKEIDFEEIRKKIIRRGNPEGEDKKQLAAILKHLKDTKAKIRVHEFVNLVAKYTADNGESMRQVLEEDLASFRKMVTKVYENMTQDVSDVLVNEQLQTANFYQERHDMFNSKMLWMISEVFQMIPEFDFERYAQDKDEYLNFICPIPPLVHRANEDIDMQRRQEAFHRLQWLKIEEDRLSEENRRLEARFDELKRQHQRETTEASMKNKIMEEKMHNLEEEEQEKQEHLSELEGLLGKNIVRTEAYIRLETDETIRMTPKPKVDTEKKGKRSEIKRDDWSAVTAATLEQQAARRLVDTETSRAQDKKRERRRMREPGRETTLFSSQQGPADYSDYPSATLMQERNIQQTTTTIQEKRPKRPNTRAGGKCPSGRCSKR